MGRSDHSRNPRRRVSPSVVLIAAAALLAGAPGRLDALDAVISQSFRTATATGWSISGNSALTSGAPDTAGAGWLRLTPAATSQLGSAIYDTAFSTTDGAQVIFTYATYGGGPVSGAGIAFYLIDGSTATPTAGNASAGLGYSGVSGAAGVTGGYLGVGLDELGDFATAAAGSCTGGCPSRLPNAITIRGSGSLETGFNSFRAPTESTIKTTDRAGAKRVRITVLPTFRTPPSKPYVDIIVDVDSGSGFVNVISSDRISWWTGQDNLPATFKMGLSATTSAANINIHEIRDLTVTGARASAVVLGSSANPSGPGQKVTFTATVSGASGTATGSVTFKDGTTVLDTISLASGVATLDTSTLSLGDHPITATYSGDGVYAGSVSDAVTQVVTDAPTAWSMNPTAGPVAGGTKVTISGSGFLTGATVAFGANLGTVTSLSSSSITVTAPAAAAASTVTVKVSNSGTSYVNLAQGYTYNPPGCWPDTGGSNDRMVGPCHPAVAGDPRDPSSTPIGLGNPSTNTVTVPPLWESSTPADSTIVFFQGTPPSPKATGRGASAPSPASGPAGSDGAYRRNTATGSFDLVLFQGAPGKATGGGPSALTVAAPSVVTTSYSNGTLVWATTLKFASSTGNGVWDRIQKVGGVEFDLPIVTLDVNGDGKADYASLPWGAIGPLLGGFIGGGGPPTQTPQIWMPLADTDGDGFGDAVVFDPTGSGHPSSFIPKSPAILPPVDERGLVDVPALGEWGLFALALSLGAAGWLALRRTIG